MLRQNHRWTTTLSVALALSLAVWVSANGVAQRTVERDADRTTQGIRMIDFQRLYEKGQVLVVDVRDRESYEQGRIAGAIHLPLDDIAARAARGAPICRRPGGGDVLLVSQ